LSDYKAHLIHNPHCFLRETYEERMELCGVRNITRMEMFVWDLEMFLQLQAILGDRLVLKGGAAVQFYLPTQYQRTSVDIDIVFHGDIREVELAIAKIERLFKADETYFTFRPHIPRAPTTTLPLYTYYVSVPTVCTNRELWGRGEQRMKVEIIITTKATDINKMGGRQIFALDTDEVYNVLPLNQLFADKLTTLGPRTIGIGNHRKDEQVKQIYDIHSLLLHNLGLLDFGVIRQAYWERAEAEALTRGITFDRSVIMGDVHEQLDQLRRLDIDTKGNTLVWDDIANFLGLYAGAAAPRIPAHWATVGEQLNMLFCSLFANETGAVDKRTLERALTLDQSLEFDYLSGVEKGKAVASFKAGLIRDFGDSSTIPTKMLKGKHHRRILWSIVNRNNLDQLEAALQICCARHSI